jgi:glycosyltransferase involved in cell wall biosynthesis
VGFLGGVFLFQNPIFCSAINAYNVPLVSTSKSAIWPMGSGANLGKSFFKYVLYYFRGTFLFFWETHKMDFWYKAFNRILATFQSKLSFQENYYFHTLTIIVLKISSKCFLWNQSFHMELIAIINSYSIYD